jgi:hypothetical protein
VELSEVTELSFEQVRRATAFHEAGHAAFAVYFENVTGCILADVSISENDPRFGETNRDCPDRDCPDGDSFAEIMANGNEDQFRAEIMYHLAGDVAERKEMRGITANAGSSGDAVQIRSILRRKPQSVMIDNVNDYLAELRAATEEVFTSSERWEGVIRLAEKLLQVSIMHGDWARGFLGPSWKPES